MQNLQKLNKLCQEIYDDALPYFKANYGPEMVQKLGQEVNFLKSHLLKSELDKKQTIKLQECTKESLSEALRDAMTMGISLNPGLKYAYIAPYKGSDGKIAKFGTMYHGDIFYLADVAKVIKSCVGKCVRVGDKYGYKSTHEGFKYSYEKAHAERGAIIGVIVAVTDHAGFVYGDFYTWEEIEKRKKVAPYKGVWNSWPEEMAIKTGIHMTLKTIPATNQTGEALAKWNELQIRHADLSQELTPQRLEEIEQLFFATESKKELKALFTSLEPFERTNEVLELYNNYFQAHGKKKALKQEN